MAQIDFNIDNYLSEEDKKRLAIDVFKEQVKKELFKSKDGTVQSDSEIQRIIGNISSQVVMEEVQKYIPDCKQMIIDKTIKCITSDNISYYVFKKKDLWDKDESLATTYINDTIKSQKELFQKRIKEAIENYDLSKDISEKISAEFDEMAASFYKLSELFYKKQQDL